MDFQLDAFFNPHLPEGARSVTAVLAVAGRGSGEAGPVATGRRAFGIVIDASPSMMDNGGERMKAARAAARACVAALDPSDMFTIVTFASGARTVVGLRLADEGARAAADAVLAKLGSDGGGTRMSTGLRRLEAELATAPAGTVCSGLLLTDGENESSDSRQLDEAVAALAGKVVMDCRGVGEGWRPDDVRRIAGALLGSADGVSDPSRLASDMREWLGRAASRGVAGVRLRLAMPGIARLAEVRQASPEDVDLTPLVRRVDARTIDVPLGAWGEEARDYRLTIEVEPGAIGDEVRLARCSIVWPGPTGDVSVGGPPIAVAWSDDDGLTTRMSPEVAHYTGQAEIGEAIKEGLSAKERGDVDGATRLLGRAARLARESGNEEVTRRLSRVVDVVDAAEGTVRLRRDAGKGELLELEMGGTRTVRRQRGA